MVLCMNLLHARTSNIKTVGLTPAEPLWKRVPTRNASGRYLHDFMMVIPGFNKLPAQQIDLVLLEIANILTCYEMDILLADFNLKTNVLWVSLEPKPGLQLEIAAAIHHHVPAAKLVAWQPQSRR